MARSPNVDLEGLNDGQLRELIQHARETLSERVHTRLDEFRAMALEAGLQVTVTKIGEGGERRGRRRSQTEHFGTDDRRGQVQAKYRNPDNFSEVWSGRGRQPKWVEREISPARSLMICLFAHHQVGNQREQVLRPSRQQRFF